MRFFENILYIRSIFINKNEMGRACSTYETDDTGFSGGNLRAGDHLEDPGVDGG